jgi:hypothetical protein
MAYKEFDKDFLKRTLEILKDYTGEREATLLINCLVGLLILPKANHYKDIPATLIENQNWGILPDSIKQWGGSLRRIYNN